MASLRAFEHPVSHSLCQVGPARWLSLIFHRGDSLAGDFQHIACQRRFHTASMLFTPTAPSPYFQCFLVNTYTRMSLVIHVCLSLIHANTCFKLNIDAKKHTHSLTHTYVYIHTCLPFSPTLSTYRAHNGNKSKEILVSTLLFNFCVSVFLAAPLSIRLFSCIGLNSIKEGAAREE